MIKNIVDGETNPFIESIIYYWKELLILGLSLAYFIWLAAPDVTWINTDSDAGTYIWSTRNWGLSHPTGAPLYNIIGNILNQGATIQEAAQNLALFSAVCAALISLIIYIETKSFIGSGIFLASGLVVSQSTIIETYAPVTLLIALSWVFRNNRYLFPITVAIGLGIHHLIGISALVLIFYRYKYVDGKFLLTDLLIVPLGFLQYIYVFLAQKPDVEWSKISWDHYFFSQNFLTLGLDPVESGAQRIKEFSLVFFGGLGLATIALLKVKDKLLLSLTFIFLFYYVTNLAPQTYVYIYPSFFFAAIAIGRLKKGRILKHALALNIIIFIGYNLSAYDIGNNLDPSPTSARTFINELEKLPEGSIVYSDRRGWETVLSWNVRPDEIKVLSSPIVLRDNEITPTHYSVLIDPDRYLSVIADCNRSKECEYRGD